MWSRVILCLFVGLAYASHSPAWKTDKEYSYHVHGRTLALLSERSNEYSGIVFNATLRAQPISDDKIMFEIREAIYSQILHKLPYWNVDASKDWEWKPLELSSRPFQVEMQNGVITDLIVSKDTPNWEANIIKSIVSQFQLNTKGENIIESPLNILPKAGRPSATYKTMEDTVTGHTETLYSINQMPRYVLKSAPRWAKHEKHYNPEDPIIEIVKHKNYTNFIQLPSYIHGLRNMIYQNTAKHQYGSFMNRECLSNALVTGSLEDFTVHTVSTTEMIAAKPVLTGHDDSKLVSHMHLHLKDLTEQQERIQSVPDPVRVGNLVYAYAISNSNPKVRVHSEMEQNDESPEDLQSYQIQASPLDQPPQNPLLPFNIGYKGMWIKQKIDIVKQVVKRCQQIASEIEDDTRAIPRTLTSRFTDLVALVRLMDLKEMKEAFEQLYTTKQDGQEYSSWVALRDAVGESGTGPALLTIKEWILRKKISAAEASDLISTITKTVRQPTTEFMRTLFDLIKTPPVQEANYLNRTALLSYSTLVRKVYVSRFWRTENQYASQTFGNLATEEGKRFAEDTVVPYFTRQLHQAISEGDTEKVHIYIRCLGNIAHPKILAAFEPYLEGEKRCSPFQRFLMVLSMEKLVGKYPELGLPIMYKIYRNIGEQQETRIAAVYQIFKAFDVPADLLKALSMYTTIDQHEHVNAAIKSAIENHASLKHQFSQLTGPARAANPFLNKMSYGAPYGGKQVFEHLVKQLQKTYLHSIETITTDHDRYPQNLEYTSMHDVAGIVEKATLQGSISSFEELLSQLAQQTQWNHAQKQKQQQQSVRQEPVWSSQNIAKLLNLSSGERPQLEGFLYADLYGYLHALSFNNHTVDQLPEAVRHIEQQLQDGQRFNALKFRNIENIKVSFPTAMGLPFVYIFNQPSVFKAHGNIKASAQPKISEENKLNVPDTLKVKTDTTVSVLSASVGVLSFVTPFDHQKYSCGFQRVMKAHVPVRGDIDWNLKDMQMRMQFQIKHLEGETQLLHYSTWPFTTRTDILTAQSIPKERNTKVWQSQNMRNYEQTFGEHQSGIAMRVKVEGDRKYMDMGRISQIFWNQGPVEALLALYRVEDMQRSRLDLYIVPEQSTTNRIVIHLGTKKQTIDENNKGANFKRSAETDTASDRLEDAMKSAMEKIKFGKVDSYDVCVEFEGSRSTNYSATTAYARSLEEPRKSKIVLMLKKRSERSAVKPFELTLESEIATVHGNWWELTRAVEVEPKIKSQMKVTFGQGQGELSQVQGEIEFDRSTGRIEYLQRQPVYEQCQREMKEGNKHLHACMFAMKEASRLDDIKMKLRVEKLSPEGRHMLQDFQQLINHVFYPQWQVEKLHNSEVPQELSMRARFDPDLQYVNLSAKLDDEQYRLNNIAVNDYVSDVFVPSTYLSTKIRLAHTAMGTNYYNPLCVVDKTRISNFNNVTFPADLSKDWTVIFQYVPHQARQEEERRPVYKQLKSQLENYVILVRENEDSGKDVKISFSTPETEYENVEITVTFDGETGKITANGQQTMKDPEQRVKTMYNSNVVLRRQAKDEIIVELVGKVIISCNSKSVRLIVVDHTFHNTIRGICGQLNEEPRKDFLAPQNCVIRDSKKFIKSYELSDEGKDIRQQLSQSKTECVPATEELFADVISDEEAQRGQHGMGECTRFQTLYIENLSEICFTTRPMPVCTSSCSPTGSVSKNVAVHCISNSPVARLWKTQIDKGASPDFSHKPPTKSVAMKLPQRCEQ